MYRLHEWEVLHFTNRLILEKSKESLAESESTGWRHTMFEHLDEFPVWHHRLIISSTQEFLLELEPVTLVERIIELGESITDFTSCDNRLESFYFSWVSR